MLTLGALRKAVLDGDIKRGSVMMGQIAGMVKEIRPMQDILDSIMEGFYQAYQNLTNRMEK